MQRVRRLVVIGLVATALLLLAFVGTTFLSFGIWFRYGNAAGLSTFRLIAQIAAGLTALCFVVCVLIIAIISALQPAGRWRKLLYVLPIYFLGFTVVGVILALIGIGTAGIFISTWIQVGAVLSIVAVLIAALRVPLTSRILRTLVQFESGAAMLSVLAWLGMVVSTIIVLTSQPSARSQGQGGAGGPGGPGGPGGSTAPLLIGVIVMTVVLIVQVASILAARRAVRDTPEASDGRVPQLDYRRETGPAIFSTIVITIVALVVAQLIPVSRTNPTPQTTIQWDSDQTKTLASRACMDCHSDETVYPWYAYVAPGSWLLASHVYGARDEFNLSELNNLPAFRKSRLPEQIEENIRSDSMPPSDYLLMHPAARLSSGEKQQLIAGFKASLAK